MPSNLARVRLLKELIVTAKRMIAQKSSIVCHGFGMNVECVRTTNPCIKVAMR